MRSHAHWAGTGWQNVFFLTIFFINSRTESRVSAEDTMQCFLPSSAFWLWTRILSNSWQEDAFSAERTMSWSASPDCVPSRSSSRSLHCPSKGQSWGDQLGLLQIQPCLESIDLKTQVRTLHRDKVHPHRSIPFFSPVLHRGSYQLRVGGNGSNPSKALVSSSSPHLYSARTFHLARFQLTSKIRCSAIRAFRSNRGRRKRGMDLETSFLLLAQFQKRWQSFRPEFTGTYVWRHSLYSAFSIPYTSAANIVKCIVKCKREDRSKR